MLFDGAGGAFRASLKLGRFMVYSPIFWAVLGSSGVFTYILSIVVVYLPTKLGSLGGFHVGKYDID